MAVLEAQEEYDLMAYQIRDEWIIEEMGETHGE